MERNKIKDKLRKEHRTLSFTVMIRADMNGRLCYSGEGMGKMNSRLYCSGERMDSNEWQVILLW